MQTINDCNIHHFGLQELQSYMPWPARHYIIGIYPSNLATLLP